MPTVVGVKLRYASKPLWFDPLETTPAEGDSVIVETERGTEIGVVAQAPFEVAADEIPAPLKPIKRVATQDDLVAAQELAERDREAMPVFRRLVEKHGLDMKPIDVEHLFGGEKIVFYFVAEERVDFRELVRELASHFKMRVDMRQIGVRDEARMIGGLGHCGQSLCCVRFGGEFQPVSIRMAKEQDLPLNPLKISGLCGRLMCCLRYEYEAYRDYKQRAPKKNAIIDTPLGPAKVIELDTPHETVTVRLEDGKNFTVQLTDMGCSEEGARPCSVSREVLEAAGGASTSLALAASDREVESESAEAAPPRPRKRRGGERQAKGAASETKAKKPPRTEQEGSAPKSSTRRRRRRSKSGSGSAEKNPAASQPQTSESKNAAPKPPKQQSEAQTGGEGGSAKTGRRRRRRRPPRGGNAGSEGAPPAGQNE